MRDGGAPADAASGDVVRGDVVRGDSAGVDAMDVDAAGVDRGAGDASDPRGCGVGVELCEHWGAGCGWVQGYDRCWEEVSAFCGTCGEGQLCGNDHICAAEICNEERWCWQHPTPQGNGINAAAGAGSDVWLVGDVGVVLRFDGAALHRVWCDTATKLSDVWASSGDDVWMVGCHRMGAGPLMTVRHYDGERCSAVEIEGMHDSCYQKIAGTGPDDIWLAAYSGDLLHFDGAGWSRSSIDIDYLDDLWAVPPDEVWALGSSKVWRRTGGDWIELEHELLHHWLYAGWGLSPSEVWLVGATSGDRSSVIRWDGDSFAYEEAESILGLRSIWGSGADNLWAAGDELARYQSGRWVQPWASQPRGYIKTVAGAGGSVIFAGSDGALLHHDGAQLGEIQPGVRTDITALWAGSATAVWAATNTGETLRWDGEHWWEYPHLEPARINGIWGDGETVWGVGAAIYSWAGDHWQEEQSSESEILSIWGSGPTDIWTGGYGTSTASPLLHYDGHTWQPVESEVEGLQGSAAIWGSSATDVWFKGQSLVHYDGSAWSSYKTEEHPYAIWGSGPGDLWIAHGTGSVLRFNGSGFDEVMEPGREEIWLGVWGRGPDDMWVSSDSGSVAHWDGERWSFGRTGASAGLFFMTGAPSGDLWVGGTGGAILRRRP